MNTSILEYVVARLAESKHRWAEIAEGSGVPLKTLIKVARKDTEDPRISTVEKLFWYFKAEDEAPPPERVTAPKI